MHDMKNASKATLLACFDRGYTVAIPLIFRGSLTLHSKTPYYKTMDTNFKMYLTLTRFILAFSLIKIAFSSSQIPLAEVDRKSPTDQPFPLDVMIFSEILGNSRVVSGFAGMTRNFPEISNRLEDSSTYKTVLAPTNKAIATMSRKPWENPDEYSTLGAEAYEGEEGKARADQNLQKFVESHIIPLSPWAEKTKVKTSAGTENWWHFKDGYRIIQPGDIKVLDVVSSNKDDGELWIIDGVMS